MDKVDRFGLGMVAGDGDPAGQAQKEDDGNNEPGGNDEQRQKRDVVPLVDMKPDERIHDSPFRFLGRISEARSAVSG
jgi:hypothetical protein